MSSRRFDELGEFLAPASLVSLPVVSHPARRIVARSKRSRTIAREFGVKLDEQRTSREAPSFDCAAMRWLDSLLPAPGRIVLITGPSGAGKSSMLRALKNSARHAGNIRWHDLSKRRLPNRPVVDCFGRISLEKVLQNLARVGLAEVWTYLRRPAELSEGQRWRLRLALLLANRRRARRTIVVCDEFAAVLDRVSAAVVARTLRRAVSETSNISAIVATSHEDLVRALKPDVVVRCDFGGTTVEKLEYRNPDSETNAKDQNAKP